MKIPNAATKIQRSQINQKKKKNAEVEYSINKNNWQKQMQKYKIIDIPYYKYKDNTIAYIKISIKF